MKKKIVPLNKAVVNLIKAYSYHKACGDFVPEVGPRFKKALNELILSEESFLELSCKGCRRDDSSNFTCKACSRHKGDRTDWFDPVKP
jgi:hypothetical protein